ncbi:NAD(P)-binding domain-containing protein [Micromonospora sp. NBC_01796]|uniref:NAD(P)-binding domain-containing protein n=1 Tax=Micromonospora sp. NBC_01796 TaxID=2975987 RepID=UPI002DDB9574|nr:NAD(P)-binding domain-containing protein [Micromonospora sp. NBC_01796]WSA82711.1 NAD(P)-binding domain-containing protein [Micromonospora sp. NBC_01796]
MPEIRTSEQRYEHRPTDPAHTTQPEPERHQYVIVGGGPAGIQLSYYLQQVGADYVTLEREPAPAHFFRHYPRHRRLISLNKVHTRSNDPEIRLRWDWNSLLNDKPELHFPHYSSDYFPHADDLVRYLDDFQREHHLAIRFDEPVERIERVEGDTGFLVRTSRGAIRAGCVIVATGWATPYVPQIDGIEHAIGYEEVDTDPAAFADQRVLILGKGNSAFETASAILGHAAMVHLASPRPLQLAWNTKHPGNVRTHYGALLDSYQFKTLHSVLDCTVDVIRPAGDAYEVEISYTHADGERELLEYDSVIRCTGFVMDTSVFAPNCRPELAPNGRMPATGPDWQSTNVPGLYFAGTIAQARDFKRASSAFIDGFRYNLRTLTRLLQESYEEVPLAYDLLPAEPKELTSLTLERLNWSSALWTQFEYLCDVLVRDERTGEFRHYQDLPEDYAVQRFGDSSHFYTVTLRWGRDDYSDVFAIERHPSPDRAAESAFIHPVVRRYRNGSIVEERHLLEDLLAHWTRPDRHVAPLHAFFQAHLSADVAVPEAQLR